jgi:DNA processing protein
MDERGLLDLIISRIPRLSPRERLFLCKKFDREEEISILSKEDIEKILTRPLGRPWFMDEVRSQAEKDEETLRRRGLSRVSWADPEYPPQLREIYDPPALLFFRGALPDREKTLAAVVGTRRPSPAAAALAYDIGRDLGRAGIPVVSGLALGIDAMAHRGNLEGGGPTIAVLGSGVDGIYPPSNRALARRILENGGALLSEYPPGSAPKKWNFPARNRIISGLARGTLILEAPARSGALITAGFALEHNRDLWVASAGNGSVFGEGAAKLAEEGAKIILGAGDILAEWNWERAVPGTGEGGNFPLGEETGGSLPAGRALAASMARCLKIELGKS